MSDGPSMKGRAWQKTRQETNVFMKVLRLGMLPEGKARFPTRL